ncbi:hypothetical protein RND81_10G056300 [Saponaria officinalis]|uniref:Uncharacterized protein n=1 Tax=Saponaria officinalis TaxID=3572 RepID=A0AAW1HYG1_SAPOF
MGTKSKQKQKKNSNRNEPVSPTDPEILGLIGSVDDLTDDDDYWSEAWSDILMSLDDEDYRAGFESFSVYCNKKKKEFRNRMIDIITRWKREVMYRKYVYTLKRDGREVPVYHQEGNDDIDMGADAVVDVFNDAVDVHDAISPDVVAPPIAAPSLIATPDVGDDAAVDVNNNVLNDAVEVDVHDAVSPDVVALPLPTDDFPIYSGGDGISFYRHPFSFGSWLKDHLGTDTRWLSLYHQWGGAKLNKEVSVIVQSLISCFLDHTELMVIHNHVGSTTFLFKVEMLNQDGTINARDPILLENDRQDFIGVLRRLVEGYALDYELEYLFLSLTRYSSTTPIWMKRFLCNYTGLWDAYERNTFFINVYARYVSDRAIKGAINSVLTSALSPDLLETRSMSEFGWQCKIVQYSVFDHILRDSGQATQGQPTASIKYRESYIHEIVRYIIACLQHFRKKPGGSTMDFALPLVKLTKRLPSF